MQKRIFYPLVTAHQALTRSDAYTGMSRQELTEGMKRRLGDTQDMIIAVQKHKTR